MVEHLTDQELEQHDRQQDLHDCRMTFPFPRAFPMAWLFVCRCGYETTDQHEAIAHGQRPTSTHAEAHQ